MYSLRDIVCRLTSLGNCAVNDNALHPTAANTVAADAMRQPCFHADPYLAEARDAKRLIEGARLISSVDGNPAAVLNLMATRTTRGRRAA